MRVFTQKEVEDALQLTDDQKEKLKDFAIRSPRNSEAVAALVVAALAALALVVRRLAVQPPVVQSLAAQCRRLFQRRNPREDQESGRRKHGQGQGNLDGRAA